MGYVGWGTPAVLAAGNSNLPSCSLVPKSTGQPLDLSTPWVTLPPSPTGALSAWPDGVGVVVPPSCRLCVPKAEQHRGKVTLDLSSVHHTWSLACRHSHPALVPLEQRSLLCQMQTPPTLQPSSFS